mmetsp:Transcript_23783/g.49198  ORF Transcript_23783/g.49198 Transcript_23783/m.49198 type:complete len:211 (+) Transcript_23783:108-740(+)
MRICTHTSRSQLHLGSRPPGLARFGGARPRVHHLLGRLAHRQLRRADRRAVLEALGGLGEHAELGLHVPNVEMVRRHRQVLLAVHLPVDLERGLEQQQRVPDLVTTDQRSRHIADRGGELGGDFAEARLDDLRNERVHVERLEAVLLTTRVLEACGQRAQPPAHLSGQVGAAVLDGLRHRMCQHVVACRVARAQIGHGEVASHDNRGGVV